MWKPEDRLAADRRGLRYPSDLEQISPGLNRYFPGCLNEGIWRH